jgi:hypothetical protein
MLTQPQDTKEEAASQKAHACLTNAVARVNLHAIQLPSHKIEVFPSVSSFANSNKVFG